MGDLAEADAERDERQRQPDANERGTDGTGVILLLRPLDNRREQRGAGQPIDDVAEEKTNDDESNLQDISHDHKEPFVGAVTEGGHTGRHRGCNNCAAIQWPD